MTSTRLGFFVDDASVANVQTQLRLLGEKLPENYTLDLFYHESFPESLNSRYIPHKVHLLDPPFVSHNQPTNILSRIISFVKEGRKYVKNHTPEAVIGFINPPVMGTVAGLASINTNTKSVYVYSGDSFSEFQSFTGISKILPFIHYNGIGRVGIKTCDEYIVFGPNGRRALTSRGIDSEQIYTIPPLIDQDYFSPGESKIDLDLKSPIGLFVGRITERKGADRLKHIMENILNRRDDISFLILGDGPMAEELDNISEERIHVAGYVPHSKIPEYYRTADFLLHPSRLEGLPNVLLEAHACGLPTVTSSAGEMPYFSDYTAENTSDYVQAIDHVIDYKRRKNPKEDYILSLSNKKSFQDFVETISR